MSRPGPVLGHTVHALDEVGSTQEVLRALAETGAPEGTVVTARHQTAGRGRRGRPWWDARGQSVLFSVLLHPRVSMAQAPQLSLVAGLAVGEALVGLGVPARLRWPNDVVVAGGKVAGILLEASASEGLVRHVLLGVGINVDQVAFPETLADRATSLILGTGRRHDHGALLTAVLEALGRRYVAWSTGGLGALRQAWIDLGETLGRPVMVEGQSGVAVDLCEDGALLVRLEDGTTRRVVTPLGDG